MKNKCFNFLGAVALGSLVVGASEPIPDVDSNSSANTSNKPSCTFLLPGSPLAEGNIGWYYEGEHKLDLPKAWSTPRVYKELESYGFCNSGIRQPSAHLISDISVGDPIGKFKVTSSFGPRKISCSGCSTFHAGIDINTPTGVPLVAPSAVEVSCKLDRNGGGIVAEFWYERMQHQFLHLNKCFPGNRPLGDIFAITGATGVGTGPHLDYRAKMAIENGALVRVYPPKEVLQFVVNPYEFID